MLNIKFGEDPRAIVDVDAYFDNTFEDEWFDDAVVKQMVLDIDRSEVLSAYSIISPVLGNISHTMLSGGVKTLIQLYKDSTFYPDLITIGPNCQSWLAKISKEKELHASLSGYDLTMESVKEIDAFCLNDNTKINTPKEWRSKMLEFV